MFMNEYEVEEAVRDFADHPILGPASVTLRNLMEWTNRNSDGWAYWPKPGRAAQQLERLLQANHRWVVRYDTAPVTVEEYRKALRPIKAFRTRQSADFVIVEA